MNREALRERLRSLEIKARYLATTQLAGHWSSNIPGNGLDYKDLREYVPGDDIRRLDWKATARTGRPHLREFREERQQTIHLALDLSASMNFGRKQLLGQELLSLLGWTAVLQKDQFALVGFTDKVEVVNPPHRGEMQLWGGVEKLFDFTPTRKTTAFGELWKYWFHTLNHRSTCIVISDFCGDLDEGALKALCQRHDVWAFHLTDPLEVGAVDGGLVSLVDAETGEKRWVDTSDAGSRSRRSNLEAEAVQALKSLLHGVGGWYVHFPTDQDYFPLLINFLALRETLIHV